MNTDVPVSYILIADDDLDDTEMLTTALKELEPGLEVRVSDNGKSVLEALKRPALPPCVVVMDMNMPRMDGRETVVALKGHDQLKNLPILLFSTSKNRTDELFAEKWGVRYFQKPDTVQGLNDVARLILEMCQERHEVIAVR
jgi:CheY-like chemotaxis protein